MNEPPDPLPILYRDEHLVAVNKPAGLLFHRSRLDTRESRFLLQTVRDQIGSHVHPVHRLDRGTSGVVIFALHAEAARSLAAAFRDERIQKTYLAVVRGYAPEHRLVDYALRDIRDSFSPRMIQERSAVTDVRRVACAELATAVGRYATARYSLVMCQPKTGRRHQIRRHMKHLRHPVIGDANYGDGVHNRFFRDRLGVARLLLAATTIRFPHPFDGHDIEIHAPLDDSFRKALLRPEWQPSLSDSVLT
jgi:tRNA pseudouridine65 synthase